MSISLLTSRLCCAISVADNLDPAPAHKEIAACENDAPDQQGADSSYRGSSSSAQAASHNVLTVTRMLLRAVGTGGQKKKLPVPSFPGEPRQSPGMAVY